jgi:hypothetical protein
MSPARLAELSQIVMDFPVAIDTTTLQLGMLNQSEEPQIIFGARRLRLCEPSVVTTWMQLERLAQPTHRIVHFKLINEGVLQPHSLAKYAAAFFRMSRSSVTRLSSARKRRSSAC